MDILNQTKTEPIDSNPSLQEAINQMLHANDNRPGFMYEDNDSRLLRNTFQEAPEPTRTAETWQAPVQQAPPAPAPQPTTVHTTPPDLLNALQSERTRNEALEKQVEVLKAYEQAMEEDPNLAQQFVNYYTKGTSDPNGSPVTPIPPAYKKQIEHLQKQVSLMQFENEASTLEREYPGMFRREHVAQYMLQKNLPNLRTAFTQMLGESVGEIHRASQMQQYQQQMQAWQHLQQQWAQYQQQMQYQQQAPQQWQQAPEQTYHTSSTPPPPAAQGGVVLRPGAAVQQHDVLDNYTAKSWKEAEALMIQDMKKAGFAV